MQPLCAEAARVTNKRQRRSGQDFFIRNLVGGLAEDEQKDPSRRARAMCV